MYVNISAPIHVDSDLEISNLLKENTIGLKYLSIMMVEMVITLYLLKPQLILQLLKYLPIQLKKSLNIKLSLIKLTKFGHSKFGITLIHSELCFTILIQLKEL